MINHSLLCVSYFHRTEILNINFLLQDRPKSKISLKAATFFPEENIIVEIQSNLLTAGVGQFTEIALPEELQGHRKQVQ